MDDQELETKQYVSGLFARARAAQKIAANFTQERVDRLVAAVAWGMVGNDAIPNELAQLALEETGFGDIRSKLVKIKDKQRGLLYDLKKQKSVGIVEEEEGLIRIAKPVGVCSCLIPSTQPEFIPMNYALFGLKTRDAIVFAPHPGGLKTSIRTCELIREILKQNGAPEDLIICSERASIPVSQEIMRQSDVVFGTGSAAMVRVAHSLGRPAYGVGAGNAVMVIDESADLDDTAAKIMSSKTFDLAAACSCDNSVVIEESVYDDMLKAFAKVGGYMASAEEKAKIQKALWPNFPNDHVLNRGIVAKPVEVIAETAAVTIPEGTTFILVEETGYGPGSPFSAEKLCLVTAVYKYQGFQNAIEMVNNIQSYSGAGHSCGIFTKNVDRPKEFALKTCTTRVNWNLPNAGSNGGGWFCKMPFSPSLGCGSWGGNVISENVQLKHFMNNTWLISGVTRAIPSDEELFGESYEEQQC